MACSVDECTRKVYGYGLCNMHYKRNKKHGSTEQRDITVPIEERFKRMAVVTPGCWSWTGGKTTFGYGVIRRKGEKGRLLLAHRLSYEIHKGPVPEGLYVLHKCDNPECTNPDHLFAGSQKENIQDMIKKGRKNPALGPKGEDSARAKLTWAEVRAIRQLLREGLSQMKVSKKFSVSQVTIGNISRNKTWKE